MKTNSFLLKLHWTNYLYLIGGQNLIPGRNKGIFSFPEGHPGSYTVGTQGSFLGGKMIQM
jgi:hypothetical protein